MVIYRLLPSKDGRKRSEFPVGEVELSEAGCQVHVPDRQLRQKLETLFSDTFRVRVNRSNESILSHSWQDVLPGTAAHFEEGLRRMLSLGLIVDASKSEPSQSGRAGLRSDRG
jgi:hypothetical protein